MSSQISDYPIKPAPFTQVTIRDNFWRPRIDAAIQVTIPYDFEKCEETGRIDNFAKAGGLMPGAHEGIFYNDSDVFKVVEGAAYALQVAPNAELGGYLDALIEKFAAAQETDGYLYTARTIDPANPPEPSGPERWSNLRVNHELYNVGHMYEAAIAHYEATGKQNFLDVAIKNADLIDTPFSAQTSYAMSRVIRKLSSPWSGFTGSRTMRATCAWRGSSSMNAAGRTGAKSTAPTAKITCP